MTFAKIIILIYLHRDYNLQRMGSLEVYKWRNWKKVDYRSDFVSFCAAHTSGLNIFIRNLKWINTQPPKSWLICGLVWICIFGAKSVCSKIEIKTFEFKERLSLPKIVLKQEKRHGSHLRNARVSHTDDKTRRNPVWSIKTVLQTRPIAIKMFRQLPESKASTLSGEALKNNLQTRV